MKKLNEIREYSFCGEKGGDYDGVAKMKIKTAGGSDHNGQPYSSDLKKVRRGEDRKSVV